MCVFYELLKAQPEVFLEKPGIKPATPGLQGIALIHYTTAASYFCGFSMGNNQYLAERVFDLCVYFYDWSTEGPTESSFMEKLGIKPACPGLQAKAYPLHHSGF